MYAGNELNSRGLSFLILNIVAPFTTCVAVLLRIWVRIFISKSIGVEDLLIVLSMVFYVGSCATGTVMALYGFGHHSNIISNEDILMVYKFMFANGVLIYLCVILLRISICLLFLRITQTRWQRRVLYSIAAVTTVINIINLFWINILYCIPVSQYWNMYVGVPGGKCVSTRTMSILLYLQYAIAAAADLITSLLPIFIMKDWVFNKRAKWVTYGLLGMGIFASGAAIGAVIINPTAGDTGDYTFTAYGIFMAQMLEPFLGLLASSFATYRPLFRSLNGTIKDRFGGSSNQATPEMTSGDSSQRYDRSGSHTSGNTSQLHEDYKVN